MRDEARAQAAVVEPTTLAFGDQIAWVTTTRSGVVDGLSPLHRVGVPKGNALYTTCDQPIVDPVLWLSVSAAMLKTMPRCGHCEANFAEQSRGIAA